MRALLQEGSEMCGKLLLEGCCTQTTQVLQMQAHREGDGSRTGVLASGTRPPGPAPAAPSLTGGTQFERNGGRAGSVSARPARLRPPPILSPGLAAQTQRRKKATTAVTWRHGRRRFPPAKNNSNGRQCGRPPQRPFATPLELLARVYSVTSASAALGFKEGPRLQRRPR